MQYHDYYKTLGVTRQANQADIQKAYRKLARENHPDLNQDADAEVRFKEIGEAYEVLGDPEKRQKYDRFGQAWQQGRSQGTPPPGFEHIRFDFGSQDGGFDFGGSGFSSFFEMLFGEQAGAHRNRQRGAAHRTAQAPRRGRDRETSLAISLADLANGATRRMDVIDPTTGQTRSLKVKIPQGILPGQKLRLSEQGESGIGGPAGDLFLTIELQKDSRFELDGRHLRTIVTVAPWLAALGGTVDVPTLDGDTRIKLPAGSSSGSKLRLRGKGLPNPKGTDGDLFVEIRIGFDTLSDSQRELYEQLRALDQSEDQSESAEEDAEQAS